MGKEIERKFRVKDDSYKELAYAVRRIKQGYLNSDPERTVRVRADGEKGYLTVKGCSDKAGISRFEWEREISLNEAEDLFRLCEPGMIDKARYLIKAGKHTVEVDEFFGENEGLVLAEIELHDVKEAYDAPAFLGEEVTGQEMFYNAFLAKHPYSSWKK